ncbi:hypothetical protein PVK06_019921 [Gossypium arboreum]|uniref:ABC1 atypical kinase-like domain-containing protein n=1 Tax=Gossypium arboreum TaxID=29729 RepID=A0ABR0PL40_GOSAR|nr:hypothetical protein PVK06_019921 [Gossypium arboreum]
MRKSFKDSLKALKAKFISPIPCVRISKGCSVHQAGLRGDKIDVVVKVQHPGIRDLMMTDIRNLQAFALYIQKNDVKFDLFSVTKEMEKKAVSKLIFTNRGFDGCQLFDSTCRTYKGIYTPSSSRT